MFLVTHEEGKKNFYLEELKLFLVKGSVGRLAGGIISAPCQDRLTPCPFPPSARPRMMKADDVSYPNSDGNTNTKTNTETNTKTETNEGRS